ncbi:acetyl-CoA hydrolase/transferase C-terminal domain-containing protein [Rhodoluna sp.]|uniref:acetyl-CoA hydrolase/transferase family protein n=1 Tax=Rhodoluna sp. TaxID=1969481 RepID=UPI0025ED105F|nr:acetyl-CoA hydrolase/transferase C-terminal domain-containing protein [Rhodoluna sp.]
MRVINYEQLKQILSGVGENPRVVASGNFATPTVLLNALDESVETYRLNMLGAQVGIPNREGVEYESAFVGPGMRRHERLNYVPSRLSLVPILFRDHFWPNIVLLHTSAPRHDTVSLGIEVNVLPAAIEAVRERGGLVIAQANKNMPYTYGDAQIYEHEIDYLIEVDEQLLSKEPTPAVGDAKEIGDRIAAMVTDGSTMQLGIGGIPDAVLAGLLKRKNLRVWTEMFSDGVLDLHKAGALDPELPLTASFLFGSTELYEWLHLNRSVRMLRTEKTNDPGQISRQAKMTSINAALEVDLYDQANASYVRGEIYSGFGGSTDFIVGALHSRGGQSFMALPSWHPKANKSAIVPHLTDNVTSFQHSYVATEQGLAACFGHTQKQQAENIIAVAHPDARAELVDAAKRMGLI